MSNGTVVDHSWSNLPWYLVYFIQGSVISSGNAVIVLSIARFEALRSNKEHILMLGLSLADTINMAGFLFAGIYRMGLLISGVHNTLVSAWQCMLTMQCLCWIIGSTLATQMLATITVDRLLCVLNPLSYVGWTDVYARSLIGFVYVCNICTLLYAYVSSYKSTVLVSATCVPGSILPLTTHPLFVWYYQNSPQLYAVFSVVTYLVVVILYKRMNAVVFTGGQPSQQYELKRQRKVTVTLGMSALCTFMLYVVPYALALRLFRMGHYNWALGLWCMSNCNPLANVFLYPLRHKEIKQALHALVTCKHMPVDLKLWTVGQSQSARGLRSTSQKIQAKPAAHVLESVL